MINYSVPFYENTIDNTHCFQATLKMVLKHFFPDMDYSYDFLDKISAKVEGKWTWPMAALLWMKSNGFDVKYVEIFDYSSFISNGEKYLFDFLGDEVAFAQIKNSDIAQEIEWPRKFIKEINIDVKIPSTEDIKSLIDEEYLVECNVNSKTLNNKSGYSGHSVLVKGYDSDGFFIHDPGLPGVENRKVTFDLFEKAWAYPDNNAKNITAFKKI